MSTEYLWFVSAYALFLTAASLVAFTERGQALVLSRMQRLGSALGVGAWGLLHTFGYSSDMSTVSGVERATLAESYIDSAQTQTLSSVRATVWVLFSGWVFTTATGIVITGVLPPLVESGEWSYGTYSGIATWLIRVNVLGGMAMGVGLVWWLLARTMRLNRSDGCSAARAIVLAAQGGDLDPELAAVVETGAYPRLRGLLADVT